MRNRTGSLLVLLGMLPSVNIAHAQDVFEGRRVAQQWCSGCHQVGAEFRPHKDVVPSFYAVAQVNSTTAMSLTTFLSSSHQNMPDFSLSRDEIQNVSAYILSLRKPR
jgi:cytochrome c